MATEHVSEKPLLVIVGPTASGKTELAIRLAKQHDGEIICADSRTVYKDMNIGTAKPTAEEQATVRHWGLDLVWPGERFTAADFKQYTNKKIADIRARNKIPLLVGGTGLYVDSVLFDYQFGVNADTTRRIELNRLTVDELHEYCIKSNIILPVDTLNKRRMIQAIENNNVSIKRNLEIKNNTIVVGIAMDLNTLRTRIMLRSEQLFNNRVVEEAKMLGKIYGWENEAMTGNVYPLIKRYLAGETSLEITIEKFITQDWRLAKRQMTWFRRNPHIQWCSRSEAEEYVSHRLA